MTLPQEGISIEDMRKTTEALLRSGAPIEEMNVVRKHLSAILGGNLARLAIERGARVEALLISDVNVHYHRHYVNDVDWRNYFRI